MNKFNLLLLASLLAASPMALAHGGMGDHCGRYKGGMLSEADTNKDGSIDKAEAQAFHEKRFEEMDTNHDGKLSKDEIAAACPRMGNAMHDKGTMGFNKADKNNDGKLTKEEAKILPNVSKNFDAIDVDKDGTVDRDEVHNFMRDHMTR